MNLIEKALARAAGMEWVWPGERIHLQPDYVVLSPENAEKILQAPLSPENIILKPSFPDQVINQELCGSVIVGCDTQICNWGGLGAVPLLLSATKLAACMGTGLIEFTVPETLYIDISPPKVETRIERVLQYFSDYFQPDGLMGMAVVIGGKTIQTITAPERKRMVQLVVEMGGLLGVISPEGPGGQVEKVIKMKAE